jgi:uncharacterized iron-regulated protein
MSRLLVIVIVLLGSACAHAPASKISASQWVSADGQPLTEDALLSKARDARFILIGEAHDNPCDHQQQARLIDLLGSHGMIGAVGFEMLATDQQTAIDLVNSNAVTEANVAGVLDWDRRWGVPFKLYRPIFDAARAHRLPLVALNAPDAVVKKVRAGGLESLTERERQGITPTLVPPLPEQESMLREAMAAHAHHRSSASGADHMWEQFVRVQSFWDSQMAYAAMTGSRELKSNIAIIAGAGHVEHGWGIAHRLRQMDPSVKVLTVMPLRPETPLEPSEADVFFRCPAVPDEPATVSTREPAAPMAHLR